MENYYFWEMTEDLALAAGFDQLALNKTILDKIDPYHFRHGYVRDIYRFIATFRAIKAILKNIEIAQGFRYVSIDTDNDDLFIDDQGNDLFKRFCWVRLLDEVMTLPMHINIMAVILGSMYFIRMFFNKYPHFADEWIEEY